MCVSISPQETISGKNSMNYELSFGSILILQVPVSPKKGPMPSYCSPPITKATGSSNETRRGRIKVNEEGRRNMEGSNTEKMKYFKVKKY